jgi:hypothetical protein
VLECLPSKCEALSSNPSTKKKRKEKERKKEKEKKEWFLLSRNIHSRQYGFKSQSESQFDN